MRRSLKQGTMTAITGFIAAALIMTIAFHIYGKVSISVPAIALANGSDTIDSLNASAKVTTAALTNQIKTTCLTGATLDYGENTTNQTLSLGTVMENSM